MTHSRSTSPTCSRCGAHTSAKRLIDLGPAGLLCVKCLDHIPSAERRGLLRRAKERSDVS